MSFGRATIGRDSKNSPVSVCVEFPNGVFTRYFDSEIATAALQDVANAYPNDLHITFSEIQGNWLNGSRAIQARKKIGDKRDLVLLFENGKRLTVGSTHIPEHDLDKWVLDNFGVSSSG